VIRCGFIECFADLEFNGHLLPPARERQYDVSGATVKDIAAWDRTPV